MAFLKRRPSPGEPMRRRSSYLRNRNVATTLHDSSGPDYLSWDHHGAAQPTPKSAVSLVGHTGGTGFVVGGCQCVGGGVPETRIATLSITPWKHARRGRRL